MNQQTFTSLTPDSGAIYKPYIGSELHYELVGISVVIGSVNNRIRVIVADEFNVMVRHSFGTDYEHFRFVGDPVQFNLGPGSHYTVPNQPPDRITVEGLPSDEVLVGNANIAGFQHTDWQMTFKRAGAVVPVPPLPSATLEQAAINAAILHQPWLPINTDAALYKFAQKNNLGYPQTDEYVFKADSEVYLGQVFNKGIVYVRDGDWQNCKWVVKP